MKALDTREADINTRQQNVVDLAQKAQQAFAAAEEARVKLAANPPNPGADPFADPWLAPVKERFSATEKRYEAIENQSKQVAAALTNAIKFYMNREQGREYESINFGKREKKPTRDELRKYAEDNKIIDSDGIPSLRLAWDKMTENERMEEMRQAAIEKGREEGRMEAMAARVTPPGVSGVGQGPAPRVKISDPNGDVLGDLYADALKDPELRPLIEGLGPQFLQ
jgi:hypothetical protein